MRMYYTVFEQDWPTSNQSTMTVLSEDPRHKFSGLYDADGNKLYAQDDRGQVGFIRFGER